MKKNVLKRAVAGIVLGALFTVGASGATYTAVTSGNWTDAATWGGVAPSNNLNLDDVVIPNGITVTLNTSVTFTGLINTFQVNGTLAGSTNTELFINQGGLTGSGDIDIHKLRMGSALSTMTFSGDLDVDVFYNTSSNITLAADMVVNDSLDLAGGNLTIGTGANLDMGTDAMIRIDAGTLAISGGVFGSSNSYDVLYAGGSKTTGVEISNSAVQYVYVALTNTNQTVTMTDDMSATGLYLSQGSLAVGSNKLTIKGIAQSNPGSMIVSNASSDIEVMGSSFSGSLMFATGSSVNDLTINMSSNTYAKLGSTIAVTGDLVLTSGGLSLESGSNLVMSTGSTIRVTGGHLLTNGGSFTGTAGYNVEYTGSTVTGGWELSGSGLNNLTINLMTDTASVMLDQTATVGGNFDFRRGRLDLNGEDLTLNGTFTQGAQARIIADDASGLYLSLATSTDDTIYFQSPAELRELEIDFGNAGTIVLGSDLNLGDELRLTSGRIDLSNSDLTLKSTATISAYNNNNYVVTSGNGYLGLNVNNGSSYVVFPVGTTTSYSPAYIQQNTAGNSGRFMVRVMSGVYANGTTGTNLGMTRSLVNRTWDITAATGVNVDMNLKLGWTGAAEVNGFNRGQAYIAHYTNGSWSKTAATQASSGSNSTYEIERKNINSLSPFAVVDTASALSAPVIAGKGNGMRVYPNPSTDQINVEVVKADAAGYVYELTDITGKVMMTMSNENTVNRIDISGLTNGIYFIKATRLSDSESVTTRFVKY